MPVRFETIGQYLEWARERISLAWKKQTETMLVLGRVNSIQQGSLCHKFLGMVILEKRA